MELINLVAATPSLLLLWLAGVLVVYLWARSTFPERWAVVLPDGQRLEYKSKDRAYRRAFNAAVYAGGGRVSQEGRVFTVSAKQLN